MVPSDQTLHPDSCGSAEEQSNGDRSGRPTHKIKWAVSKKAEGHAKKALQGINGNYYDLCLLFIQTACTGLHGKNKKHLIHYCMFGTVGVANLITLTLLHHIPWTALTSTRRIQTVLDIIHQFMYVYELMYTNVQIDGHTVRSCSF